MLLMPGPPFAFAPSAVGRQVTDFTVTPSTLHTGDVPAMNISFTPSTAVLGNGTLTLSVQSTEPFEVVDVFANATPEERGVLLVGLPNCSGATGAIDPVNHTLTITLPSTCVLDAFEPVTVVIPSDFFAPNPPKGTTVALTLTTSSDVLPSEPAEYTIGMCAWGICMWAMCMCRDAYPCASQCHLRAQVNSCIAAPIRTLPRNKMHTATIL